MHNGFLPLSILALAIAIVWAAQPVAQAAEGPGPGAVCEYTGKITKRAPWMDARMAEGRHRFLAVGNSDIMCAW